MGGSAQSWVAFACGAEDILISFINGVPLVKAGAGLIRDIQLPLFNPFPPLMMDTFAIWQALSRAVILLVSDYPDAGWFVNPKCRSAKRQYRDTISVLTDRHG